MILVTVENLTMGSKYTYQAKSQKQANAWVNWIQVDDAATMQNCPNCKCHLRITVAVMTAITNPEQRVLLL